MRLKQIINSGPLRIAAYSSDGGKCELLEFMWELKRDKPREFKAMYDLFRQASARRIPPRSEKVKYLGEGIFEFKKGDARVLWFEDGAGRLIVCSHGFTKKSQETPDIEFARAVERKKNYFRDKDSGRLFAEWEHANERVR